MLFSAIVLKSMRLPIPALGAWLVMPFSVMKLFVITNVAFDTITPPLRHVVIVEPSSVSAPFDEMPTFVQPWTVMCSAVSAPPRFWMQVPLIEKSSAYRPTLPLLICSAVVNAAPGSPKIVTVWAIEVVLEIEPCTRMYVLFVLSASPSRLHGACIVHPVSARPCCDSHATSLGSAHSVVGKHALIGQSACVTQCPGAASGMSIAASVDSASGPSAAVASVACDGGDNPKIFEQPASSSSAASLIRRAAPSIRPARSAARARSTRRGSDRRLARGRAARA